MKIISFLQIDSSEDQSFIVKPDTCLLRNNDAFYLPPFSDRIVAKPYLFVKVTRMVKAIELRFAGRCYEEGGVAVEFCALDVLEECRRKGLPWDRAVSYDKSLAVPIELCQMHEGDLNVSFKVNDNEQYVGLINDMEGRIDRALSVVSQIVTLKIGDILMIPLTKEHTEIKIGDMVKAGHSGDSQLDFDCK